MILETLWPERSEYLECPLWWHKEGLEQTASGYGRKLATRFKFMYKGRKYRVYVCQISNSGTTYIIVKGNWVVLA